jgi:hypothetical protein
MATATRPLYEIASDVRSNWPKINYAAKPYLDAMGNLTLLSDNYFEDSARSIVLYFLNNTGTWRGEDAKRIKAELRGMLK